jgi:hypothetical protein
MDDMEKLDSGNADAATMKHTEQSTPRNLYMTNRSLNLESAVTFASLVAAYHIDTSTRNRQHLDVSTLIERAIVVPKGFEEI